MQEADSLDALSEVAASPEMDALDEKQKGVAREVYRERRAELKDAA